MKQVVFCQLGAGRNEMGHRIVRIAKCPICRVESAIILAFGEFFLEKKCDHAGGFSMNQPNQDEPCINFYEAENSKQTLDKGEGRKV